MFKDDYKKANDSLKPDEKIINAISAGISESAPTSAGKIKKFPIKRVISIAASIAIVLSALIVYPYILPDESAKKPRKAIKTTSTESVTSAQTNEVASENKVAEDISPEETSSSEIASSKASSSKPQPAPKPKNDYTAIFNAVKEGFQGFDMLYSEDTMVDGIFPESETDSVIKDDSFSNVTASKEHPEFSDTNLQVENVLEADIVKTDGKYIYALSNDHEESYSVPKLRIYKAAGKNTKRVFSRNLRHSPTISSDEEVHEYEIDGAEEMFLLKDKLYIIARAINTSSFGKTLEYDLYDYIDTMILVYNVEDPEKPKRLARFIQSGRYSSSRMTGDQLYVITNKTILKKPEKEKKHSYIPYFSENNKSFKYFSVDDIYLNEYANQRYTIACSYSGNTLSLIDKAAVFGGSESVYMNEDFLVISSLKHWRSDDYWSYNTDRTQLNLFRINNGEISLQASRNIAGKLLNQFSMDFYDGYLRLVTTVHNHKKGRETNSLLILDTSLNITGKITGLAKSERIYSARFMGDLGYFVTYRETDPLYCADLSNPKKPKILSALKIPGFSTYLHPYGNGLLLGLGLTDDWRLKLSMFDISDPENVAELHTSVISEGSVDCEALDNHKAFFVDAQKNIFGFPFFDFMNDNFDGCLFPLYKYTKNGFEEIKKFELDFDEGDIRGMYIGEYFYISSEEHLRVYDMKTWEKLKTLK